MLITASLLHLALAIRLFQLLKLLELGLHLQLKMNMNADMAYITKVIEK